MPSIFDNPAPALFQNPRNAGLLGLYDPMEAAFRASYAPPPASTNIYRPGQPGSLPSAPPQSVYQPAPGSIWDSGGNATSQGPTGATADSLGPAVNQSQMGDMDMMSPANAALGLASMVSPAIGLVANVGKVANMLGPAANLSDQAIAIGQDPAALQAMIADIDPSGAVAINPDPNSALFQAIVAQQHAASQPAPAVSPEDQEAVGAIGIDVGNTGDGAASGDSGTVICTELHRRGWLDDATYQDDVIFGVRQEPEVIAGYHRWAIPYVRLMRRPGIPGALATALAVAIALPWAKAMRASVRGRRGPVLGRIIMAVGLPICRWLGRDRGRAHSLYETHPRWMD